MQSNVPADMPEYLREMIENNTFKDQPEEFKRLVLQSWRDVATGNVTKQVREAAKLLREESGRLFEIAKAANLLCQRVEEYVVRESAIAGSSNAPEGRITRTEEDHSIVLPTQKQVGDSYRAWEKGPQALLEWVKANRKKSD